MTHGTKFRSCPPEISADIQPGADDDKRGHYRRDLQISLADAAAKRAPDSRCNIASRDIAGATTSRAVERPGGIHEAAIDGDGVYRAVGPRTDRRQSASIPPGYMFRWRGTNS